MYGMVQPESIPAFPCHAELQVMQPGTPGEGT